MSFGLNSTQLKVLAAALMTIDHIGEYLLPQVPVLRFIGRPAFPIFAYLIAEGCRYTSSKPRYLANLCAFGLLSQLITWHFRHTLAQSIFTTLALSVATIYALQWWAADGTPATTHGPEDHDPPLRPLPWHSPRILAPMGMLALDILICKALPLIIPPALDFHVDYRLPGVLLPAFAVAPWLGQANAGHSGPRPARRTLSLALFAVGLCLLCASSPFPRQWWSLAALAPLALYNGQRGGGIPKYAFYAYYPLHLAAIYALAAT